MKIMVSFCLSVFVLSLLHSEFKYKCSVCRQQSEGLCLCICCCKRCFSFLLFYSWSGLPVSCIPSASRQKLLYTERRRKTATQIILLVGFIHRTTSCFERQCGLLLSGLKMNLIINHSEYWIILILNTRCFLLTAEQQNKKVVIEYLMSEF